MNTAAAGTRWTDGTVYFSNLPDGRIYRQERGADPVALTADGPFRYGDLVIDPAHGRLLCVREDHTGLDGSAAAAEGERHAEARDALIAVDTTTGAVSVLAEGYDFYSTPRPSPDGQRLAWLAWRHPNMPWDTTELWLADVDGTGRLANERMVAGGGEESVVQPEWAPDGSLVFASDRSGWWNLYRMSADGAIGAVTRLEQELAGPPVGLWHDLVRHCPGRHDRGQCAQRWSRRVVDDPGRRRTGTDRDVRDERRRVSPGWR